MAIAKVEPLTTARALRGPFDYALPERMSDVDVGSVLVVPLGPRRTLGVVVEIADRSELGPERLAEPLEALEAGVPAELVRLGLWVAREYCSTPARGLRLVLPPGTGASGRQPRPRRELLAAATPAGVAALDGSQRLGKVQRAALASLAEGERSAAELATAGIDRAVLRRLAARGLVRLRESELRRAPALRTIGPAAARHRLDGAQREAAAAVVAAIDGAAPRELLLHGVTGSGKTEVYLAAVEHALERGRGAIVMVPEIALTPQTMSRFRARFGDAVALLHSRLGAGERFDEWRRLRSGAARVCVGPRSAVFAPVADLGLIVIDEEHDGSYKQEGDPRYDARLVARRRAAEAGAALVAGSATPRPESWRELPRVELPRRVDGGSLPPVDVLDMRDREGGAGPLHAETVAALGEVRGAGGKAIVMLNRRGWSPHLTCRGCGHHWGCPECDVSMVMHRHVGRLACHHCGRTEPLPSSCPGCGSVTIARLGAGTERIERVLGAAVEPLPVFRLDSDSAARAGSHLEILSAFDRAPSGLLVGTQMVGKGHDFPAVVLSVILDADSSLRVPDFRAEERTFAMVAQLAGRSGRGEAGGRVLVQTLAPDAPSIRAAAQHDSKGFLAAELERREALGYPPFCSLIRVSLAAPAPAAVQAAAAEVAARVAAAAPPGARVLGPAPALRTRGRHRRQILVKAADRSAAVAAVREAVESAARLRALRGVALSVDVDPQ